MDNTKEWRSRYLPCMLKVEQIQQAFQLALKAFHMSGSEVKSLKIGRVWKGMKVQNTLLDLTSTVLPL